MPQHMTTETTKHRRTRLSKRLAGPGTTAKLARVVEESRQDRKNAAATLARLKESVFRTAAGWDALLSRG